MPNKLLDRLKTPLLPSSLRPKREAGAPPLTADKRAANFLSKAASAGSAAGPCLECTKPYLALGARAALTLAPVVGALYSAARRVYAGAPKLALRLAFGLALCFFGGIFTASVAAVEAFRHMGGARLRSELQLVLKEAALIGDASARDDGVDADADGVADVEQLGTSELLARKAVVAMRAVGEPERLASALGALWAAYLAVLATLKLEFAQCVALALGAADCVRYPAVRLLAPPCAALLAPHGIGHWTPTAVDAALKLAAVALAWYLQAVVSAFYSALRGGRMVADALCEAVIERGWQKHAERLPGVVKPFHPDTSHLDEAVAYGLAGAGFGFQLLGGFALPFPLNLVFLPLTIIEWLLRWQVTFAAPGKP